MSRRGPDDLVMAGTWPLGVRRRTSACRPGPAARPAVGPGHADGVRRRSPFSMVPRCGKPRARPRRPGSARGDVLCDVHHYLYAVLSCAVDGESNPRVALHAPGVGRKNRQPSVCARFRSRYLLHIVRLAGPLSPAGRPPSSCAGSARPPRGSPGRARPPGRAVRRPEARRASPARTGAAGRIPGRPCPPRRPPPR